MMDWYNMKQDDRPKRFGWAPGNYTNICDTCNDPFMGDKRARMCADCAYDVCPPDETVTEKKICCDRYEAGLKEIDSFIITQTIRTGVLYKNDPFEYCPWCGTKLEK